MQRKQAGFTLLEISIVMIIIGLLMTLTLKGRELVENSRVKNLANDFRDIQLALYGYQDRFRALPGDDRNASEHFATAATSNGNGNQIIEGAWNAPSGEAFYIWQHMRLGNFIRGTTDPNSTLYVPRNASGGTLGITESGSSPIFGLRGQFVICSNNIPGRLVKQLDRTLDDGNTAGGSLQATHAAYGGNPISTVVIVDNESYLVCLNA